MKHFLLVTCALPFLFYRQIEANSPVYRHLIDSGHVAHVLDGSITEWPLAKFQLSDDSTIEYALDNDNKDLYVAMTIPDYGEQMKIMRNGMKLLIDLKGKKKEGKGIEFPVKGEAGNSGMGQSYGNNSTAGEEQPKKLDRKTERTILSLGLVSLKLFGFGKDQQEEQGLTMPGSVNIAFKWDELDAMHIEYNIPLELLGEISSLNQKDITIGWKINGFDRPQGQHYSTNASNEEGGGYSKGTHGGGGRGQYGGGGVGHEFGNRSPTAYKKADPEEMRKEQNFWTKYSINIPSARKAF